MTTGPRWLLVALLLTPAVSLAQSVDPPPWRAQISGRVVSAETGAPLSGATVSLSSTRLLTAVPPRSASVTADEDGTFVFPELPAGDFSITVSRGGYYFGGTRRFEAGARVERVSLRPRQQLEVTLAMNRGGAITGRLLDELGEPLAAARVTALRYAYEEGAGRQPSPAGVGDFTDDRGEFRLFGLPPGDYAIVAGARPVLDPNLLIGPARPATTPPTYFPGTLIEAEAQTVSLGPGEEASVQFGVQQGRVVLVSGRAVLSDGTPAARMQALLWSSSGSYGSRYSTTTFSDGAFRFAGVTPGDYWVNVSNRAGGAGETASIAVEAGRGDVGDLSIVMRRGATLRGTVVFDGRRPQPSFTLSMPFADGARGPFAALGDSGLIRVGADGRFEATNVIGRVAFASMHDDWIVTAVTAGGADVLDSGIETAGKDVISGIRVTVTSKLTSVSGRVADRTGEPLGEQLVVLLRLDGVTQGELGIRALRTDAKGTFEARKLRAGSWVAGVVDDLEPGYHLSPEFQQRLRERGQRFTLADGEAIILELTPTPDL
jgi:hypothetical protein